MTRRRGIAFLIASSMLAGCGRPDLSRPPSLRFGEEACAYCRMIISDERFAAALVTESGEVLKFDDVGCLIRNEAQPLLKGAVYWVRNYGGPGWINAREATFVYSTKLVSPMNHGLAALPSSEAARKLAVDLGGRTLRFSELTSFKGNDPSETASNLSRPQ